MLLLTPVRNSAFPCDENYQKATFDSTKRSHLQNLQQPQKSILLWIFLMPETPKNLYRFND